MPRIKTIDAEVAGESVRLIVEGAPSVPGRTMADKRKWLQRNADQLRRMLMLEPRGHAGIHGAMITTPVSPDAHFGLLSMHAAGFPLVSGEAIIAAVTIGLEQRLIEGVEGEMLVDTAAGVFRARPAFAATAAAAGRPHVVGVSLIGPPASVQQGGLAVRVRARAVNVDIAFGGETYAIADSEAVGIPIDMSNAAALVRMGRLLEEAIRTPIQGTIFTGAAIGPADLRSATVLDGEVLRRSPGVTGTAALLAVLDAMGLLAGDASEHRFTHEGIVGTALNARVLSRDQIEGRDAVIPVIEGAASSTGFHEFVGGYYVESADAR